MQFIALLLAAQLATAARANSGTSSVCAHWFGNNLDWTKITEATRYGNTPWGDMKPGMRCTKRCYLRGGRYGSFKRCPQGCVDGKCTANTAYQPKEPRVAPSEAEEAARRAAAGGANSNRTVAQAPATSTTKQPKQSQVSLSKPREAAEGATTGDAGNNRDGAKAPATNTTKQPEQSQAPPSKPEEAAGNATTGGADNNRGSAKASASYVVKTAVSTTAAPVALGSETVNYGIRFSLVAVMMLSVGVVAVMILMIILVIRLRRSRKDLGQDPEECREDSCATSSV